VPPTQSLQPELISRRGDWFAGVRLPEYRVKWRGHAGSSFSPYDLDAKLHDLEVVGRHLRCTFHMDRIMVSSVIPISDHEPRCWKLAALWPRAFTSGSEYLAPTYAIMPDDQAPQSLGVYTSTTSNLNFARTSIAATMVMALALELDENTSRYPQISEAEGDSVIKAIYMLRHREGLGALKTDMELVKFLLTEQPPKKWMVHGSYPTPFWWHKGAASGLQSFARLGWENDLSINNLPDGPQPLNVATEGSDHLEIDEPSAESICL
jgi:hypothetical protein